MGLLPSIHHNLSNVLDPKTPPLDIIIRLTTGGKDEKTLLRKIPNQFTCVSDLPAWPPIIFFLPRVHWKFMRMQRISNISLWRLNYGKVHTQHMQLTWLSTLSVMLSVMLERAQHFKTPAFYTLSTHVIFASTSVHSESTIALGDSRAFALLWMSHSALFSSHPRI